MIPIPPQSFYFDYVILAHDLDVRAKRPLVTTPNPNTYSIWEEEKTKKIWRKYLNEFHNIIFHMKGREKKKRWRIRERKSDDAFYGSLNGVPAAISTLPIYYKRFFFFFQMFYMSKLMDSPHVSVYFLPFPPFFYISPFLCVHGSFLVIFHVSTNTCLSFWRYLSETRVLRSWWDISYYLVR